MPRAGLLRAQRPHERAEGSKGTVGRFPERPVTGIGEDAKSDPRTGHRFREPSRSSRGCDWVASPGQHERGARDGFKLIPGVEAIGQNEPEVLDDFVVPDHPSALVAKILDVVVPSRVQRQAGARHAPCTSSLVSPPM